MKLSRIILIVVVVLLIVIVALAAYSALMPKSKSPWESAAEYPINIQGTYGVSGQECVNSTAYLVCIGGQDVSGGPHNAVYTSSAISSSSSNITSWISDSSLYPQTIYAQSCVASSGYIYCVGGTYDDAGDDVNYSYYAPLSSSGAVGAWSKTTDYPFPVDSQSCVASSGYIYCVGGTSELDGDNASRAYSDNVYFATLSSSGIGAWKASGTYPSDTYLPSCYATRGVVYCLGGIDSDGNALGSAYYAPLSSAGVGTWTATNSYQVQGIGEACAFSSGYIYCVGGEVPSGFDNSVYYASVSSNGIGNWVKTANYPDTTWTTCVISSGNMYCVGGLDQSSNGETGAAYYISLSSLATTSMTG